MLRFEPVAPFTARVMLEDVEFRDVTFPQGTVVMACQWTANRESEGDADPREFDIRAPRGSAKSLTFGAGPHFCLGMNLARAELQEGLSFLAPRMPGLALDGEPVYDTITGIYGMHSLPVRWSSLEPRPLKMYKRRFKTALRRVVTRRPAVRVGTTGGAMGSRVNARIVVVGLALLLALAALAMAAKGPADVARAGARGHARAACRPRSAPPSHGIPHIVASDFPGLGFGYGYAAAKENICVLADTYVTVNAERSRWFGPDASYSQGGNGTTNNNLNSDFFFQKIKDNGSIERLLALDPPRGPRPEIKAGRARLRRRLQQVAARDRRREHHRPALPGRRLGAPDHRDGRVPPLLPARTDCQPGRRDRRHRRRTAAGRRRPHPADPQRRSRR